MGRRKKATVLGEGVDGASRRQHLSDYTLVLTVVAGYD